MRLDVLLNPGFTAPLVCPCPQVTVFHDLQHKRHPEYFRWFDLPFWNFFLFWSAHVSRLLLAVSAATAADLLQLLPPARIRRCGWRPWASIRSSSTSPAAARPSRSCWPSPRCIRTRTWMACCAPSPASAGRHPEFRLVVCGLHGFSTGPLHDLRDALGLRDAVDFPGWIPREELHDLYARAWAFLYPSRFEGFGLPVLEALAAGIPTACSADRAAGRASPATPPCEFDPLDTTAMAEAMLRITADEALRTRLAEAGPRRAAQFSWRETAETTLAALRSAGSGV